jgi:hypothetical protein
MDERVSIVSIAKQDMIADRKKGRAMTAPSTMQDQRDHFAYCVQLFGGATASSRRLGIDERAIRRFINGERPLGTGVLRDTAKALRLLIAEATEAEEQMAAVLDSEPNDPQTQPD